ncbi:PepSY-like domain-containing protein [Flavobacterium sp.]
MKNILFVVLAMTIGWTTNYAQTKAPKAVVTAFETKFPKASNVTWDKENSREYEAAFEWNGTKHSANFNTTGKWLETENATSFEALPLKVQNAFKADHKSEKIKEVAKIETSNGDTFYEIEVNKSLGSVDYLYTADGTIKK